MCYIRLQTLYDARHHFTLQKRVLILTQSTLSPKKTTFAIEQMWSFRGTPSGNRTHN